MMSESVEKIVVVLQFLAKRTKKVIQMNESFWMVNILISSFQNSELYLIMSQNSVHLPWKPTR